MMTREDALDFVTLLLIAIVLTLWCLALGG